MTSPFVGQSPVRVTNTQPCRATLGDALKQTPDEAEGNGLGHSHQRDAARPPPWSGPMATVVASVSKVMDVHGPTRDGTWPRTLTPLRAAPTSAATSGSRCRRPRALSRSRRSAVCSPLPMKSANNWRARQMRIQIQAPPRRHREGRRDRGHRTIVGPSRRRRHPWTLQPPQRQREPRRSVLRPPQPKCPRGQCTRGSTLGCVKARRASRRRPRSHRLRGHLVRIAGAIDPPIDRTSMVDGGRGRHNHCRLPSAGAVNRTSTCPALHAPHERRPDRRVIGIGRPHRPGTLRRRPAPVLQWAKASPLSAPGCRGLHCSAICTLPSLLRLTTIDPDSAPWRHAQSPSREVHSRPRVTTLRARSSWPHRRRERHEELARRITCSSSLRR